MAAARAVFAARLFYGVAHGESRAGLENVLLDICADVAEEFSVNKVPDVVVMLRERHEQEKGGSLPQSGPR